MHHRRHRARRNPAFLGITLPPVMDIAAIGTGLIVAPMVANYVWNNFAASVLGGSKWGYLAVEAASVYGTGYAIKRFVNPKFGSLVMIGGFVKVALDVVNMLAPTLIPAAATPTGLSGQPFLGFYEQRPRVANPGLGVYFNRGQQSGRVPGGSAGPGRMIATTADRLDPTNRF